MFILICGDLTACSRGAQSVKDNKALSEAVLKVINRCDACIVNLEAPVTNNLDSAIEKFGPCLSTNQDTIEYMKKSGINVVTLANNHFYDYGDNGSIKTLTVLDKYSIRHVGAGEKVQQMTPLCLDNICVFNYCESEFSVDHEYGSNKLNPIRAFYEISSAKNKGLFVVVIVHGGHEGYQLPSPRMKQLYRFFVDCGAKVVVNHHQHCYSGYEEYHGGVIFYGLGNFFFDSIFPNTPDNWYEGYMVGLEIEDGKYKYFLYPYHQCKDNDVCVKLMGENDKKTFWQKIASLNKIITNDELLEKEFHNFIDTQEENYMMQFTPYTSKIAMALYRKKLLPSFLNKKLKIRLLNTIRCEAHRDACIYLLGKY